MPRGSWRLWSSPGAQLVPDLGVLVMVSQNDGGPPTFVDERGSEIRVKSLPDENPTDYPNVGVGFVPDPSRDAVRHLIATQYTR